MKKLQNLTIRSTFRTPEINLDAKNGILSFSGKCIPENPVPFFAPINDWISLFLQNPTEKIVFDFAIEYINTSSLMYLHGILRDFQDRLSQAAEIVINWYYEADDEDGLETGRTLTSMIKLPVNFAITSF